jgi:hypothetical protein
MSAEQGRIVPGGDPDEPIDGVDEEVLALLRTYHEAVDPMPAELIERTVFALALTDLDSGLIRLAEQQSLETVGARGEESRVITFDSESRTVMIRISPLDGAVRIDGWLAPPAPARVELRTALETVTVRADEDGRFVLEGVPRGLAQLAVHTGGTSAEGSGSDVGEGADDEETVLTPAIVL